MAKTNMCVLTACLCVGQARLLPRKTHDVSSHVLRRSGHAPKRKHRWIGADVLQKWHPVSLTLFVIFLLLFLRSSRSLTQVIDWHVPSDVSFHAIIIASLWRLKWLTLLIRWRRALLAQADVRTVVLADSLLPMPWLILDCCKRTWMTWEPVGR